MRSITLLIILLSFVQLQAQINLLDEDSTEEQTPIFATAVFKTTRVINGHSTEMIAKKEFDFKISHRFGFINGGAYELFGLDQATVRIGGDFGITDNINVGFGRSTVAKTYDGFVKYRFLRQQTGPRNIPVTMVLISHMGINTLKFTEPDRTNYFTSRLHYTHQLLISRKFSKSLSVQLSPTMVHKNLTDSLKYPNDIFALGVGFRQKLTVRTSVNFEYFFVFPGQLPDYNTNALSVGFDIETGGHVFQLFFTNATAPFEKGFITDSRGRWSNGDVHFGFNVARIFNF